MMRFEAVTAVVGVVGTIGAELIPSQGQMEAMGRWPVTLVMAVIAVVSIYLMYRGNRDNSADRLAEAKMHQESINTLAKSFYDSHQQVIEALAETAREAAATRSELRERPCIRKPGNN